MSTIPTIVDRIDTYRIYCSPYSRLPLSLLCKSLPWQPKSIRRPAPCLTL